jgi:hypothetical protein
MKKKTNQMNETTRPLKALLLATLLLVIGACTEEVDIELDSSYARLVVDGQITTDTTTHYVKLTKTMDYFANRPAETVSGAEVRINNHLLTESQSKPGLYLTEADFCGEVGKKYRLTIRDVDINNDGASEFYHASDSIHSIARADSIDLVYQEFAGGQMKMWAIHLYAQDPPEENHYLFKVYKNDTLVTDTIDEYVFQEDVTFNGNYVPGVMVQSLDKSKKDERVRHGDVITLEANGISREYYKYIIEVTNESGASNPLFSGPRANVRTNVKGGGNAVGFFRAFSINRMSLRINDPYEKVTRF